MVLASLIGGFIVILVGVNLFPAVADAITESQWVNHPGGNATNITGAPATILGLTNIFFALGIMSAGVNMAVSGLRQAGML